MTGVTTQQPVAWQNSIKPCELYADDDLELVWKQCPTFLPLYTTDQAEAYAAAKVREPQEWQPIETAPKDGSMILLGRAETEACGAVSVPGYWQEGFDDGVDYMGVGDGFVDVNHQQFSGGRDWGPEKYRYAPNQPTHWRPLPPPPSE